MIDDRLWSLIALGLVALGYLLCLLYPLPQVRALLRLPPPEGELRAALRPRPAPALARGPGPSLVPLPTRHLTRGPAGSQKDETMSTKRRPPPPPTDPIVRLRTMRADIYRTIASGVETGTMPEQAVESLTSAADHLSDAEEFMAPDAELSQETTPAAAQAATEGEPS